MPEVLVEGRAVLFDLDDTLLDHTGAARDALIACAPTWGLEPDDELEVRWRALEAHHYRRFQAGELTLAQQRVARMRAMAPGVAVDDTTAARLFEEYWATYRRNWRPVEGAADALARAVGAGLAVGILTNGERAHQQAKLDETGLARPDVHLVASSELGVAKPRAEAFERTCAMLGMRPDRTTVMVGDSWENDVAGALGAGLAAVHVDPTGTTGSTGDHATTRDLGSLRFRAC